MFSRAFFCGFALVSLCLGACREPSVSDVAFRVVRDSTDDSPDSLSYAFTYTNVSDAAVWFPSCGGTIARPSVDVTAPGQQRPFRVSGTACSGSVPLAMVSRVPGVSKAGRGKVPRIPGAQYVPSILFARSASGALQELHGESFVGR
jgi:hypothetical protein